MSIENDIVIALPDGEADAVLLQPSGEGKWPGVLYLTDIGGIRPAQRKAAARVADEGYAVLLPNVFYRTAKPPVMDMAALRPNPELFMKRVGELTQNLTPEALESDAKGYVSYFTEMGINKIGVVGFCFSGAFAMRVAAACADQIPAAASFHGGHLYTDQLTSPHLLLPQIKARLLFGHAAEDRSMPAEAIIEFDQSLAAWGGKYESETYPGTKHGWTTLDNPIYNSEQAGRAYQKMMALFDATLK